MTPRRNQTVVRRAASATPAKSSIPSPLSFRRPSPVATPAVSLATSRPASHVSGLAQPAAGATIVPVRNSAAAQSIGRSPVVHRTDPLVNQTKPDVFGPVDTARDHTLDSPLQAVGEGWKMIAYLIPTLIFIVVCLNLLRRYQQKNGRLPGVVQAAARSSARSAPPQGGGVWTAIFGRSQSTRNQEGGTAAIRLLESIPIGTATLHLVQVRGKVLLLAGTGAGVTVLTEFEEREGVESDHFRTMLQAAAADMVGSELTESAAPVTAVVGSLEDAMRNTGDAMARRLRRLRTVQEAEDAGL